jgi:ribA/ribD-fused uncharacterized protein
MTHVAAIARLGEKSNVLAPTLATDFFEGRLADSLGAGHHELRRLSVALARLASELELVRRQPGFTSSTKKELTAAEVDEIVREALAASAAARDAVRYVDVRIRDPRLRYQQSDTIRFYGKDKPYFELTNFSAHAFGLDGALWPTAEHYFQAQKHQGTELYEQIRLAASPEEAKDLGNGGDFDTATWSKRRDEVMRKALDAKFRQNGHAFSVLMRTGNATLIEASPRDRYWGAGSDGSGRNRLGELLMDLRELLRDEERERRSDHDPSHP